jgi:hypothetical protein
MGLFGNKEQKQNEEAAGAAELERLAALSPEALAAELLPAFGPGGAPTKNGKVAPMRLVNWLLADYPRHPGTRGLVDQVMASLELLTTAGLLRRSVSGTGSGGQYFALTESGEQALASGDDLRL